MEITEYKNINNHRIFCIYDEGDKKKIVIFCHGFRGDTTGPNRFFVRLARKLQKEGVGTFRFDQYGSGSSEGDFFDSSFNDWVLTTEKIAKEYMSRGFRVSLFGQSMGGSTVLVVGSALNDKLSSVVAWVPDPSIDELKPQGNYMEESGQKVSWNFWKEAHGAKIPEKFEKITIPTYIVMAENDQYVSEENKNSLISVAKPNHKIETLKGQNHSTWSYDVSEEVINKTSDFLSFMFGSPQG